MTGTTILVNPLPVLLEHYEGNLRGLLKSIGEEPVEFVTPGIELGHHSRSAKIARAATIVREHRRLINTLDESDRVLVLWPTFNNAEPLQWASRRSGPKVHIIVHDPTPLRRQYGSGWIWSSLSSRPLRRGHPSTITHTQLAASVLTRRGWPQPTVARLPLGAMRDTSPRATRRHRSATNRTVAVVGQFKPSRDIPLIERVGAELRASGYQTLLVGRGWPVLPGWDRIDAFLSEEALESILAAATCVLIPYLEYYQSDIAIRAAESGVPVVGLRHEFLTSLFGNEWPGLVDSTAAQDWVEAVQLVQDVDFEDSLEHYRKQALLDWKAVLSESTH